MNFITNVFLKIPQGYCKLVKPSCRKLWCLSTCIKSNSFSLTYFLGWCKGIAYLLFWIYMNIYEYASSCLSNITVSIVESFDVYLHKESILSLTYSLTYYKEFANLKFGYFGHEWPCSSKLMVSFYRKFWYLSAWKKINLIPHFFLEILQR